VTHRVFGSGLVAAEMPRRSAITIVQVQPVRCTRCPDIYRSRGREAAKGRFVFSPDVTTETARYTNGTVKRPFAKYDLLQTPAIVHGFPVVATNGLPTQYGRSVTGLLRLSAV
jgi:hypothetical protein